MEVWIATEKYQNTANTNSGLPSFSSLDCSTVESPLDFMAFTSTLVDPADAGRSLQNKIHQSQLLKYKQHANMA